MNAPIGLLEVEVAPIRTLHGLSADYKKVASSLKPKPLRIVYADHVETLPNPKRKSSRGGICRHNPLLPHARIGLKV